MAVLAITGGMRSIATDIAEVHAGVLPLELALEQICYRATIRMATLPIRHPLYLPICQCAAHNVK